MKAVSSSPQKVLSTTSMGVLLVMMNMSTLNVALPSISIHFQASLIEANWVILAYMLFNTIFILIFGKVADLYGRKKLYITGLFSFTALSVLCGYAPNVEALIALRALQGISGALVITNTTPMITEAFKGGKQLSSALGINVLVSSAAQLLGPVIGGYFTHMFSWQWIFWINVPVGITGTVLAFRLLPSEVSRKQQNRFDYLGSAIIFFGLGSLVYALSSSSTLGWSHTSVILSFIIFVLAAWVFGFVEKRVRIPVVNFTLFSNSVYTLSNIATFLNSIARSSVVLLMALFFQLVYKVNPLEAGLYVLPMAFGTIIASMLIGQLSGYFQCRTLTTSGLLLSIGGMVLLTINMSVDSSLVPLMIGQFLIGLGSGIFMTPNTQSILLSVSSYNRGTANGLRSMLQNMGGVLSTALSLMIVASTVPVYLKEEIYAGDQANISMADMLLVTQGFRLAFLVMMAFTVLSLCASIINRPVEMDHKRKSNENERKKQYS